ncbi:WD repeat-containing protein 36-like [Hibiscus syriacus]|uniref:WD repeat-containing protein 36-like n=1 Tax=Hibiscus syriacus TaxID=106335 RepID=UPI00192172D3|nr:WD repeat-containing protein 36-like [Hibiscus syriacus]
MDGSQTEDSDEPITDNSVYIDASVSATLIKQIPELVTLSLLPKSQWQSLINLDIIKVRNRPIEPPKKPEKAPFFLPSAPSLSGERLFTPSEANGHNDAKGNEEEKNDRKLEMPPSAFLHRLQSSAEMKNFLAFTDYIKGLSPSALDMELWMLQIIDDENLEELDRKPEMISIELLLDYFVYEISSRNNFEFIQAVIRLFMKIHGETIRLCPKLQDKAKKLLEIQSEVWQKIDTMFQQTRCMVTFLSNSQF